MMSIPNRDKSFSGSKMGVLVQRSFSTVVLLGLLAGALWWDCELGYYGLVCIFCILAAWEWRHMLLRSGKASQPNLSFLFGVAYPVLLSWSCCITKFRESALAEQVSFLIPLPLLVALAAPVLLVVVAFIREMKYPVDGSRALRSVGTTLLSFIYPVWLFSFCHSGPASGVYEGGVCLSGHCHVCAVGRSGNEDGGHFCLRERVPAGRPPFFPAGSFPTSAPRKRGRASSVPGC